jgi:hypothetical protein
VYTGIIIFNSREYCDIDLTDDSDFEDLQVAIQASLNEQRRYVVLILLCGSHG